MCVCEWVNVTSVVKRAMEMKVHLAFTVTAPSTSTTTRTTTSNVHKAAYCVGNVCKCGTFSSMNAVKNFFFFFLNDEKIKE